MTSNMLDNVAVAQHKTSGEVPPQLIVGRIHMAISVF